MNRVYLRFDNSVYRGGDRTKSAKMNRVYFSLTEGYIEEGKALN